MKRFYGIYYLLLFSPLLVAQSATVRGKIIDGESGEPLIGATVSANQNGTLVKGTATDLDGAYSLELEPGDYQLLLSFIAYATDSLDVTATAGEVVFNETVLYEEGTTLATAVVTAQARQSSSRAITLLKQNSNNAIDGISSDFIQRTGDRNLATAVPRITGVSVESGKYISVRGLGDRYSKTMLNGGEIPALDAERNTTQLDIFPSTLVDNIIVYKNFSPDLPGDFTGGLVDIRTKTHPTEFQLSFSASVSYNPTAHLRDDFLTYEGGNTDWLGIDDGTRDIPAFVLNGEQNGFPLVYPDDPSQNRTVFNLLGRTGLDSVEAVTAQRQQQSFGDFYTIRQKRSGLNQNYQFSVGNQTNLFGKPFGFLVGLSYRRAFQYNEDYRLARFETVLGEVEPRRERDVMGVVTEEEALWGGILGLSYKLSPRNKFSFTYMRNQSGINTTRQQSGTEEVNLPTTDLRVDETQSFQERSLDLFQLRAEHVLGKVKLDWQGSYTFSTDDQPDFRIVQYLERGTPELRPRLDENGQPIFDQDGNFIIDTLPMTFDYQSSINDFPTRYYRNLDEDNIDLRLNLDVPWRVREEREAIIGLGGAYTFKDRSFSEERYAMELGNIKAPPIDFLSNGDIDLALAPANANYVQNEFSGTFNALLAYDKRSQGTNAYRADQSVLGAYAMIEYPITASLRTVAGVRLEVTEINIATDSLGNITQGGRRQPPIRGGLSEQDLLPAVNLIYGISEKMNLRGGYSRTLARPSFRELAPYRSFAFFGDFVLFGNEDIERTLIDNFDLRWEWFPSPGQLFSIGGFYKDLDQPIVRAFTTPGGGEVSYLNVPRAEAFGFEVEVRKNLGFVADWLNVIQVNGNFTLLQSRSDLDSTSAASARIRGTEDTRPLFGQPSYTFNAELAYLDPERPGFQASLSYSIFGERMTVGGTFNYNVFEQPRGVLNATLRKTLGERWAVRVRARNLLDPEFREFYRDESIPGGREDLFESFRRGRRISVGLSYRI